MQKCFSGELWCPTAAKSCDEVEFCFFFWFVCVNWPNAFYFILFFKKDLKTYTWKVALPFLNNKNICSIEILKWLKTMKIEIINSLTN